MEYLAGGTITQLISERMQAPYLAYIANEILKGLEYLHKQQFGHCDIKPDNGVYLRT